MKNPNKIFKTILPLAFVMLMACILVPSLQAAPKSPQKTTVEVESDFIITAQTGGDVNDVLVNDQNDVYYLVGPRVIKYDATNNENLVEVAKSVWLTDVTQNLHLANDILYVSHGGSVTALNPDDLTVIGEAVVGCETGAMDNKDNTLYVADKENYWGCGGVYTVDITDPTAMYTATHILSEQGNGIQDLAVNGNVLVVSNASYWADAFILTDPLFPELVNRTWIGSGSAITHDGADFFIAASNDRIIKIDYTNPVSPTIMDEEVNPVYKPISDMEIGEDGTLYLSVKNTGGYDYHIFASQNFGSNSYDQIRGYGTTAIALSGDGEHIFAANGIHGAQTLLYDGVEIVSTHIQNVLSWPGDVVLNNGEIVARTWNGLYQLNFELLEETNHQVEDSIYGSDAMTLIGENIAVGSYDGFILYDSDLNRLDTVINGYTTEAMTSNGEILYVVGRNFPDYSVFRYDLSSNQVISISLGTQFVEDVVFHDNNIIIMQRDKLLSINESLQGDWFEIHRSTQVGYQISINNNDLLAWATWCTGSVCPGGRVYLIDINDASNPVELGFVDVPWAATGVVFTDYNTMLVSSDGEIHEFEWTGIEFLSKGSTPVAGYPSKLYKVGEKVALASQDGGLFLFKNQNPPEPEPEFSYTTVVPTTTILIPGQLVTNTIRVTTTQPITVEFSPAYFGLVSASHEYTQNDAYTNFGVFDNNTEITIVLQYAGNYCGFPEISTPAFFWQGDDLTVLSLAWQPVDCIVYLPIIIK